MSEEERIKLISKCKDIDCICQDCMYLEFVKNNVLKPIQQENQELKEEINKISKKELKVYSMLKSIEYGTLTEERLDQIKEVLFELGGDVDDE